MLEDLAVTPSTINPERRTEQRQQVDQTIRWKHPGVAEDRKGWVLDRSPSGLGFLVTADSAPQAGDRLHVRRWDTDRWATVDRPLRVARAMPSPNPDLVVVGCRME